MDIYSWGEETGYAFSFTATPDLHLAFGMAFRCMALWNLGRCFARLITRCTALSATYVLERTHYQHVLNLIAQ